MLEFRLSVEALGKTRFAYSPLAEVGSSLRLLGSAHPGHLMSPWLREVYGTLDPADLLLLRALAPPGRFAPSLFFAWSTDPTVTIGAQLETLAEHPAERFRADCEQLHGADRLPAVVRDLVASPDCGRIVADAVGRYWDTAIAPYWLRLRSVIDDDIAYRASRMLSGGIYDLLGDLHPEVALGNGGIYIDKPQHADAVYAQAELSLLPSVFVWPNLIVAHDTPDYFQLIYAARGVGRVWEDLGDTTASTSLAALIGRGRAAILTALTTPMTTTQLARELGQSAGTVSEHLSVLRRSGLLTSWRTGRSVLYRRTPLAASMVAATECDGDEDRLAR